MDARLTDQLKRLADREGATLYVILLTALKALLYRYTGQNDFCVGSAIANRQYRETEGLFQELCTPARTPYLQLVVAFGLTPHAQQPRPLGDGEPADHLPVRFAF